jgi:hypothetical protein
MAIPIALVLGEQTGSELFNVGERELARFVACLGRPFVVEVQVMQKVFLDLLGRDSVRKKDVEVQSPGFSAISPACDDIAQPKLDIR